MCDYFLVYTHLKKWPKHHSAGHVTAEHSKTPGKHLSGVLFLYSRNLSYCNKVLSLISVKISKCCNVEEIESRRRQQNKSD